MIDVNYFFPSANLIVADQTRCFARSECSRGFFVGSAPTGFPWNAIQRGKKPEAMTPTTSLGGQRVVDFPQLLTRPAAGVSDGKMRRLHPHEREMVLRLVRATAVARDAPWADVRPTGARRIFSSYERSSAAGAFSEPVVGMATVFAAHGERHTIEGWLGRLAEIQEAFAPFLSERSSE